MHTRWPCPVGLAAPGCRFPIRDIGCARHANLHGAISLQLEEGGSAARVGVAATAEHPQALVTLRRVGQEQPLLQEEVGLGPGAPLLRSIQLPPGCREHELTVVVQAAGRQLLEYSPDPPLAEEEAAVPDPATEPAAPQDMASSDELYLTGRRRALSWLRPVALPLLTWRHPRPDPWSLRAAVLPLPLPSLSAFVHAWGLSLRMPTCQSAGCDNPCGTGLHLEQYRHPTRDPCSYWREALARDPGDARCSTSLALWHLRRGEFGAAERHFRAAVARLTARNPNPADGQPHYGLGLALRGLGREEEAYTAFYKASWSYAWRAPAHYALAQVAPLPHPAGLLCSAGRCWRCRPAMWGLSWLCRANCCWFLGVPAKVLALL